MKPLLYSLACLCLSSICVAAEPNHGCKPPEIRDGVADLIKYDHEEFVAIKFLNRIQSGVSPTKTKYQPVITDAGIDAAKTYLLEKRFEYHRDDEFQQRKSSDRLNEMLKSGSEPFKSVAAVTHIRIDIYTHLIDTYDFDKSAFPFRPGNRGFSAHVSLYETGQPFQFEAIPLDHLLIEPELAEKWKNDRGTLTAICRIGSGFAPRKGFPALRVTCDKIEFRTREGELLKEVAVPPATRDIDKDFTMEEMTNIDDLITDDPAVDNSRSKDGNKKRPNRILVIVGVLLAIVGTGWGVIKIRSRSGGK